MLPFTEKNPWCTVVGVNLSGYHLTVRNLPPMQKGLRTSQHTPSLEELAETSGWGQWGQEPATTELFQGGA